MSETQQRAGIDGVSIVSIVVDDVEEALTFYTERLGFEVRMDEPFEMNGHEGRWVTVGVPGQELEISLEAADEPYYDAERRAALEAKRGTESGWTFRTGDCEGAVAEMRRAGVEITREPRTYPWGIEAAFADPSGNEFSLFEYAE